MVPIEFGRKNIKKQLGKISLALLVCSIITLQHNLNVKKTNSTNSYLFLLRTTTRCLLLSI